MIIHSGVLHVKVSFGKNKPTTFIRHIHFPLGTALNGLNAIESREKIVQDCLQKTLYHLFVNFANSKNKMCIVESYVCYKSIQNLLIED